MTDKEKKIWKITGGVAAGALVVYLLFFKNREYGGNGVDPTGNDGPPTGGTVSGFSASKTARELYDLMAPAGYANILLNPSEAEGIVRILANVSQTQFGQVITAFGNLPYNKTLGSQVNLTPWSPLDRHNLVVWLQTELGTTSETYLTLKRKYSNYL